MKHIVIIGAGAAGLGIAQDLDKALDPTKHALTLVSQTDYYRHHPAALRTLVTADGELEKAICLPYDKTFGKNTSEGKGRVGAVKIAKVASVEESEGGEGGDVLLANGERVPWDILVVTTGSVWNGPLRWPEKSAEVGEFLKDWRAKFATARSIVLVGGGSVGFELAGEILDFYPQTQLSLVHRDTLPLNGAYPDPVRRAIARGLEERGARLVLGDSVALTKEEMDGSNSIIPGGTVTTAKGVTLPAELVVSHFLRYTPGASC
jgi:apoptosis-inducing factor 2